MTSKYGEIFKASIGAEAIHSILSRIDLDKLIAELKAESKGSIGQRKKKALRRLKLAEGLKQAGLRPEWMILTVLPVIPPDLRPMVQLDGGRFAASDLNDLYRRVINRNNRLRRLLEMEAPEVICRNEKRMLQEAVDSLIDNSARREKTTQPTAGRRKLRSLADMLKGKQGRFRQNLLGKRVDYSGRSVIVVGPYLKLDQCGIPKMMALELFKPFVISRLISEGHAHNVKSAGRMIERAKTEVWDALEEVIKDKYVLLNRAPTLHRLGIQAFKPVLIEGKAIHIHPLVCRAFNADFDGDQMAVHIPLSLMAQKEAREIMLSTQNLLKPAAGEPIVQPDTDMVFGCYWLTLETPGAKGEGKYFSSIDEAIYAYSLGYVDLQAKIKINIGDKLLETTVGRAFLNRILPDDFEYINEVMTDSSLKKVVATIFDIYGSAVTAKIVDEIKDIGFRFSTRSASSISIDDIELPKEKKNILEEAKKKVVEIASQYNKGLITEEERYGKTVELWHEVKVKVQAAMEKGMDRRKPIAMMIDSGARGDISQVTQLGGMKGLVSSPTGEIIELPVKASYKEGLSILEYFISTHGARKGLSDTALRTSDSGYLTRRLVDVAQDIVVSYDDCNDTEGLVISKEETTGIEEDFQSRITGRVTVEAVADEKSGEIIVPKGQVITKKDSEKIDSASVSFVKIRSILKCKSIWGICTKCYGLDLGRGGLIKKGEAVGIIAAQSIGEPGTQLTMKTFHAGGIAGVDITQGLPRVEELFEARTPKGQAVLSEIAGIIKIKTKENKKIIKVTSKESIVDEYEIGAKYEILVSEGDKVSLRDTLAVAKRKRPVRARFSGHIKKIEPRKISILREKNFKEYEVEQRVTLRVKDGEETMVGQQLTDGSWNLQEALKFLGEEAVQRYIISEVQKIYASQGQTINDKHIEIIIRQMFSRCRVDDPGDTPFISGEIVSKSRVEEENKRVKTKRGKLATTERLILPISKVALTTDSFLSAASFQETSRVLTNAATKGIVDRLKGLKENVIIGRLIPAGTGFREE